MEQLIVSPHLNPLPQGERADASASTLSANLKGEHSQLKLTGHGPLKAAESSYPRRPTPITAGMRGPEHLSVIAASIMVLLRGSITRGNVREYIEAIELILTHILGCWTQGVFEMWDIHTSDYFKQRKNRHGEPNP